MARIIVLNIVLATMIKAKEYDCAGYGVKGNSRMVSNALMLQLVSLFSRPIPKIIHFSAQIVHPFRGQILFVLVKQILHFVCRNIFAKSLVYGEKLQISCLVHMHLTNSHYVI